MASSSSTGVLETEETLLTRQEAVQAWANKQVFKVQSKSQDYLLYILYNTKGKIDRKSIPVCIYNDIWHHIGCDKITGELILKELRPEICKFDNLSEEESNNSNSNHSDDYPLDQEIRNQPISPAAILSLQPMSITATLLAPTTTQTTGSSNISTTQPTAPTASIPNSIQTKLSNALCHNPRGALGGGGGGRGSGSGRGGALEVPGGLGGPNVAQNPIPQVADVRAMGALPQIFSSNHTYTDNFIKEVKTYLCLNDDVPRFNSPMKQIAFVLTLIKGPDVTD